jgi:hypothetical protein
MMQFPTYRSPDRGGYGYETLLQFSFRPQPVEMTPTRATAETYADPNNLTTQLATILRESFGIESKSAWHVYQKPYPNYYDQLPYHWAYRVLEFSKFSGDDGKTTLEQVGQFIVQCGQASANDASRLYLFPLSLSNTTFTWFSSLAPNSIFTWDQLEHKFHEYFILEILSLDFHILLQSCHTPKFQILECD